MGEQALPVFHRHCVDSTRANIPLQINIFLFEWDTLTAFMTSELTGQLKGYDPFADTGDTDSGNNAGIQANLIHIRIQQRNGRKTLTTVQGIHPKYDLKKMARVCKKLFNCNGTVVEHAEYGEVIQLQGDKRETMRKFLTDIGIGSAALIKVHGF